MSADPVTTSFEVSEVDEAPDVTGAVFDVSRFADYLLTRLMRVESGVLHSDFAIQGGQWTIQAWDREVLGPELAIAAIEHKGRFRAVLAHIAHRYMADQIHGGYSFVRLSQGPRRKVLAIYLANDQWRGYWIRAFIG